MILDIVQFAVPALFLSAASVTDIRAREVPYKITLGMIITGTIFAFFTHNIVNFLYAGIIFCLLYISSRFGTLGGADILLASGLSLFHGENAAVVMIIAFLLSIPRSYLSMKSYDGEKTAERPNNRMFEKSETENKDEMKKQNQKQRQTSPDENSDIPKEDSKEPEEGSNEKQFVFLKSDERNIEKNITENNKENEKNEKSKKSKKDNNKERIEQTERTEKTENEKDADTESEFPFVPFMLFAFLIFAIFSLVQ